MLIHVEFEVDFSISVLRKKAALYKKEGLETSTFQKELCFSNAAEPAL
jgi:hypothetical protein